MLDPLLLAGEVATCGVVDLEILHSAESPDGYHAMSAALGAMPEAPFDGGCMEHALGIQAQLAARSQHRGVSLPDLLVAACAERAGLTVLHYDADFERIGAVTGQPTRWIVPRGSIS